MSEQLFWVVDNHASLTAAVKSWLLSTYGYTPDPTHTWGAIISIHSVAGNGVVCLDTFPFTFVAADYTGHTSNLKAAIDAAVQTRVATLLDAQPLDYLVGRRWPL